MQTLHFSTVINASKEKVWDVMLSDKTYREWSAIFMPGSHFVGDWEAGSKIQFLAPDENGVMGGMSSEIAENKPYKFISIKHLGIVSNGVVDTTSDEAKRWVGFENYTYRDHGDKTELLVDVDVNDDFKDYMNEEWPKALAKLKELCEK